MRALMLGIAALAAAGCAPALAWHQPGATEAQLRDDDWECRRRAEVERMVPAVRRSTRRGLDDAIELAPERAFDFDAYRECMESRGWRRIPAPRGR